MFRNFLTLTFRNFNKNKNYVIINIFGMGLSLACCIVAYLNLDFGLSFDRNHENVDHIFKIHTNKEVQGDLIHYGITPMPLGPQLKDESAGIKMLSRYAGGNLILKKNENVLSKYFGFVDEDYLNMFTYPLKHGDKESLKEQGNIILSEETAELYFEDEYPIGKFIKLRNGDKDEVSYKVTGVLEKIPQNTSMQFDGLISFESYFSLYDEDPHNWKSFIAGTFVYLDNPQDASLIVSQLEKYIPIQNAARNDWLVHSFRMIPLTKLGAIARDIRSNWMWSAPDPAALYAPPIMAFLMLLIACFNFTNTSIAISSKRMKEIGIRKVMGSNRKQLIIQFMTENIVLCLLSLILSLAIAAWLVPAYSAMWDGMDLNFDLIKDISLILFLCGLLIITALLAGIYPSFYISSYQPVSILRGSQSAGGASKFSYALLTLQFVFTVMSLFASLAFVRNANYQKSMDLGFDNETIVYTQLSGQSEAEQLKNILLQESSVQSVGLSSHHIGRWTYSRTLSQQDFELEADMVGFGENYFETMGLELVEGRLFDDANREYDKDNSIIVNEQLVHEFGWEEPLGQRLSIDDSTKLTVVGVIKNFYFSGFWSEIDPMGIRSPREENMRFVVAKTTTDKVTEVYDLMESGMLRVTPNKPFNGRYQDELLKESLEVNYNIVIIFSFLGILAIILSSIGLFTLVSLNVHKRTKEIGIRKVLGASISNIILLLNKQFALLLISACVVGTTLGFYAIDALIASIFTYYQSIDAITVVVPIAIVCFVSVAVSSTRIFGSASRNPVTSLRYE